MIINDENIKYMKRQLNDYGYYTKKIKECDARIADIILRKKDLYKASGIRYDEPISSSDPHFSAIQNLINEEGVQEDIMDEWIDKRDSLKLDHLLERLSKELYELIDLKFFDELTYEYIAVNKQYNNVDTVKRKIKKAIKFLVKNY